MLLTVIEKLLVKSYASIRRTVSSDPTVRTSPRSLAAQPMPTMATVSNKMATISIVQGSRLKVACASASSRTPTRFPEAEGTARHRWLLRNGRASRRRRSEGLAHAGLSDDCGTFANRATRAQPREGDVSDQFGSVVDGGLPGTKSH